MFMVMKVNHNNPRRYLGNGHPKRPNNNHAASAPPGFSVNLRSQELKLSNDQLIAEALEINHAGVGRQKTLDRYEDHLVHFSQYLASTQGADFYSAKKKHVRLFMRHLEQAGGEVPHASRLGCAWCQARGYPDGRNGEGWSASYRKSHLSAIKFLYRHFMAEEDLPDINPAAFETSPKVITTRGYTPSAEDVEKLLAAQGSPKARLLVRWMFYAPCRRAAFATARWRDIDLAHGTWDVVGKGDVPDVFDLHSSLIRELRKYQQWQLSEATRNPAVRDALSDDETAYVLLTCNGRPMHPSHINKALKRLAIRAGVGLKKAEKDLREAVDGKTSRLSPHALRRSWATIALNDEEIPIDVVSQVLRHKDIATTRRHYAPTKPERARHALRDMSLGKRKRKRSDH